MVPKMAMSQCQEATIKTIFNPHISTNNYDKKHDKTMHAQWDIHKSMAWFKTVVAPSY